MRLHDLLASHLRPCSFYFHPRGPAPCTDPRAGLLSEADWWRERPRGANQSGVTAGTAPPSGGGVPVDLKPRPQPPWVRLA